MLTNKIKKINIKQLNIPEIFHITEFKCFRMLTHVVLEDNRKAAQQRELIIVRNLNGPKSHSTKLCNKHQICSESGCDCVASHISTDKLLMEFCRVLQIFVVELTCCSTH